ncbi:hypothetical protein QVD17_38042 [Tagetes erecta]|uniref:Transposase, Ptta/En/Spm, plant n=1 Tax=Tagetes erecta TaxID=13708 RepID=A0AAD8JX26_TARER|nr:hypothetical protein QVD17_38042 [Tagetes erecta]
MTKMPFFFFTTTNTKSPPSSTTTSNLHQHHFFHHPQPSFQEAFRRLLQHHYRHLLSTITATTTTTTLYHLQHFFIFNLALLKSTLKALVPAFLCHQQHYTFPTIWLVSLISIECYDIVLPFPLKSLASSLPATSSTEFIFVNPDIMARGSTGGGRGRGRGNGHDSFNTGTIGRGNGYETHDNYKTSTIGRGNGHDSFSTGTIGQGNGHVSSNTCIIGRGNGHENYNTDTIGRSHSDAYEALSQSETSDDDDLTVGRRGPVAPTPLPEPRNREWIWITHNQFSNQQVATRTIGEILHAMWSHPWKSWKEVSKEDGDRMFERFKGYYQWESQWDAMVRRCWEKFIKTKIKNSLNRARENAKVAATKAGLDVEDDLSLIIPYKPRRMRGEIWEPLVQYWNTPEWKAKSARNTTNRGKSTEGKHTLGAQTYATLKLKMDKKLGRPATVEEVWAQSHGKKGTRPLDRLSRHVEGECSKEYESLEDIDLQNNVEWVDSKAEESFRLYKEYVKEKYGDDTSKRPFFDIDTLVGGKKSGRFDIRDPHVMTMVKPPMLGASSSCSTTTNEEVQQMKDKIVRLEEEKETERLEKEKERAEKLAMMEQIEENTATNAQMKHQIEFLLKNIPKNSYAS